MIVCCSPQSVIVKSIERNAANMYRARQALLGQECESCAANCNSTTRGLNGTSLPLTGINITNLGKFLKLWSQAKVIQKRLRS